MHVNKMYCKHPAIKKLMRGYEKGGANTNFNVYTKAIHSQYCFLAATLQYLLCLHVMFESPEVFLYSNERIAVRKLRLYTERSQRVHGFKE